MQFLKVSMPILIEYDERGNEKFEDLLIDPSWIMEPKCYGRRVQCMYEKNEITFANSKAIVTDFHIRAKKIVKELKKLKLPDFLIDGALVSSGGPNDNMKLLSMGKGCSLEEKEKLSEKFQNKNGHLLFHVWDVMYFDGKEMVESPYIHRRKIIEKVFPKLDYVKVVKTFKYNKSHHWHDIINDPLNLGCVLKLDEAPYIKGSNKFWLKRKKFSKYNVIITQILSGKGKYEEVCNSIKIGIWEKDKIKEIGHVGGFPNKVKEELWANRESMIGKVIEIEAQEFRNGSFILPRFKKLAEDKNYKSCREPIE